MNQCHHQSPACLSFLPSCRISTTHLGVVLYILSGVTQPLLMTLLKVAGLANARAQLYMLFYYLGPSLLLLTFLGDCVPRPTHAFLTEQTPNTNTIDVDSSYGALRTTSEDADQQCHRGGHHHWNLEDSSRCETIARPNDAATRHRRRMACVVIAFLDIGAQAANYTGASLAGPTLFAVIYSSVTVWTAILSRLFLDRPLATVQWMAVGIVFVGLAVTAADVSASRSGQSHQVVTGTVLIFVGSASHASTYVLSEALMRPPKRKRQARTAPIVNEAVPLDSLTTNPLDRLHESSMGLSVRETTTIQAVTACTITFLWQLFYTWGNVDEAIIQPAELAGTTFARGLLLYSLFGLSNLVHAVSFFHTLRHYPGGATSAGVFKGLQAVLVFVVAHCLFCGRIGGSEMCFSWYKFVSLTAVCGGVALFAVNQQRDTEPVAH